jgi:hypothetical protein
LTTGSGTLTTTIPNTCAVTISFKNNCAKSKRIAVEVYMVRADTEEINVEQQEAGATALTDPQNTKNDVDVETTKKNQVETTARTILATNTEDLEIETTNKFKNQVAKIGANHQPL